MKPNAVILVAKNLRNNSDISKIQAPLNVPGADCIHPVSVGGKQQKEDTRYATHMIFCGHNLTANIDVRWFTAALLTLSRKRTYEGECRIDDARYA